MMTSTNSISEMPAEGREFISAVRRVEMIMWATSNFQIGLQLANCALARAKGAIMAPLLAAVML